MSDFGTLDENDGAPTLTFVRVLPHSMEKVWQAISDPAEMKSWFPAEVTTELRVGAAMSFYFPEHKMEGPAGEIVELDPPHVFAFLWGDELIRMTLQAEGAGCRLTFTHAFKDRSGAAKFMAGWHVCLDALDVALAGNAASGSDRDAWQRFFNVYLERYGGEPKSRTFDSATDEHVRALGSAEAGG